MATSSVGMGGMIDVSSIVSQLMTIERAPLEAIGTRLKGIDTRLSEMGKLQAALDRLRSTAGALSGASGWNAAQAQSARPEVVDATASAGALPGSHTLRVDALAQNQTLVTGPGADSGTVIGGGTLSIQFGTAAGGGFAADPGRDAVSISVGPGATLAQVRDAINRAGAGISASLVTDTTGTRLMIRGNESGEAQAFRIDAVGDGTGDPGTGGLAALSHVPGTGGGGLTELQAARNAQVEFDGLPLSLASNDASELLDNVSFSFRQVSAEPVAIRIGSDAESLRKGLDEFVEAYNELNSLIRKQTAYDPSSGTAGPLQGNQIVTRIQSEMRRLLGETVDSGEAGLHRLSDAGIEIQRDGSLKTSENRLELALADPGRLQALFAGTGGEGGATGIGQRLSDLLDRALGSEGPISGATESLRSRRTLIEDQERRLEDRLTLVEARLRRQYSALDANLAQLSGSLDALSRLPLGSGS